MADQAAMVAVERRIHAQDLYVPSRAVASCSTESLSTGHSYDEKNQHGYAQACSVSNERSLRDSIGLLGGIIGYAFLTN